jgi:hypothetical protein
MRFTKSIFFFFLFSLFTQFLVAQSFVLDFKIKKIYGDPYIFTDFTSPNVYFVFIRKAGTLTQPSLCVIETDAVFKVLRMSETNCADWNGDIVFQETNATNIALYISGFQSPVERVLRKLVIDKQTLAAHFDKVSGLNIGEDGVYLRYLSDGKTHYIVNVLHKFKTDSLVVLTIKNGVSKGIKRYLLPKFSDYNTSWKSIFKGKRLIFADHPLVTIDPLEDPNLVTGLSENKLYLTGGRLIMTIKLWENGVQFEKIITIDCEKETIKTQDAAFPQPKFWTKKVDFEPSTTSFVAENYLFQAWTNGEVAILVAKTLDSLTEINRWVLTEQDTFDFKNSPIFFENKGYWFADKQMPLKGAKGFIAKIWADGLSISAHRRGKALELQFGSYKFVEQKVVAELVGAFFMGKIGGLIGGNLFPDYERATYFWLSLNPDDLSPQKNVLLPDAFNALCEDMDNSSSFIITNYFIYKNRRALLSKLENQRLEKETYKRYFLRIEE